MGNSCLLLGATGLVGSQLLELLYADPGYSAVVVLVRREFRPPHLKVKVVQADLGDSSSFERYAKVDHVYCCLGTTIKKAGSQEAFRQVDFEYPVNVARAARAAGARRFVIVTAVDADPNSSVFYNRVKGEVEHALQELEFPEGTKCIRPSILLGEREESRPAERFAAGVMRWTKPVFSGPLKRYRAIEASEVARAMHQAGTSEPPGFQCYEGKALFDLVKR